MSSDEHDPLIADEKPSSGKLIETESEKRWRWISIIITYLGTFATFLQSSLYWASLWPYLTQGDIDKDYGCPDNWSVVSFVALVCLTTTFFEQACPCFSAWNMGFCTTVDPTTPESFFGIIISGYSLGAVIAAPILGWWSNKIKLTRWPIVVGFIVNIAGNLLMAFVEAFPETSRRWVMLLARFIAGFGSGNNGVAQAFLAHASTLDERNSVMGFQAATLSAGVLIGPGLAALFSPIGYPAIHVGPLHFDMYTMGAWVSAVLSVCCIVLYLSFYNEYDVSVEEEGDENSHNGSEGNGIDHLAAFNCLLVRFVMLFCVVYDDTIGSPFTMSMFDWSRSEAVLYNGIIQAVSGCLDFAGNILVGTVILKYVKERTTMLFGIPFMMMFYVVSFSWPGLPKQNHLGKDFYPNGSYHEPGSGEAAPTLQPLSSSGLRSTTPVASQDEVLGCNYEWCEYTTRIVIPQYLIAYVFLTLAFSTAFTPTSTLFTKVLGPRRQGTWQGIFIAAGNLAMTISPVLVSVIFEYSGPRVAWGIAFGLLLATLICNLASWRRLVPFEAKTAQPADSSFKQSSGGPEAFGESDVGVFTSYDSIGGTRTRRPSSKISVRQLSRYDNSLVSEVDS